MSDKAQSFRNHPNSPCAQPFTGGTKSGKRGWWLKGKNVVTKSK